MKKSLYFRTFIISICFTSLLSCNWFATDQHGIIFPKCTVAWRTETLSDSSQRMKEMDGIVYFAETYTDKIVAINAKNGQFLWKSEEMVSFHSQPAFLPENRVAFSASNINNDISFMISVFNQENGALLKKIMFSDSIYANNSWDIVSYNSFIIWNAGGIGQVMLDIDNDLIWDETLEAWTGTPTVIKNWPIDEADRLIVSCTPSIYNNVLYGGYKHQDFHPGTYFAVDMITKKTLWETSTGDFLGYSYPVIMLNDKLIVQNFGYGIINPETGDFQYASSGILSAYPAQSGSFYHDGKMFMACPKPPSSYEGNVFCVDAMTGEILWVNERPGTHGTNPIVYNGIVYIAMQGSIELYNAETGEFLGHDTTLAGDMWQLCNALQYEDLMIFKNSQETIAIKMDFYLDSKGRLQQN